jgi:hypothetical protein
MHPGLPPGSLLRTWSCSCLDASYTQQSVIVHSDRGSRTVASSAGQADDHFSNKGTCLQPRSSTAPEPPRESRRLFGLSHAAWASATCFR